MFDRVLRSLRGGRPVSCEGVLSFAELVVALDQLCGRTVAVISSSRGTLHESIGTLARDYELELADGDGAAYVVYAIGRERATFRLSRREIVGGLVFRAAARRARVVEIHLASGSTIVVRERPDHDSTAEGAR